MSPSEWIATFVATYRAYRAKQKRARSSVNNGIRDGKLQRPDRCECCGTIGPVEAHHRDYEAPLDVVWLSPACHRRRHRRAVSIVKMMRPQ